MPAPHRPAACPVRTWRRAPPRTVCRRERSDRGLGREAWSRPGPRRYRLVALIAAASVGAFATLGDRPDRPASKTAAVPSPRLTHATDRLVRRRVLLGYSVLGRRIYAVELGDPDNERKTLVVGEIHGNEGAGRAVTRDLAGRSPPREAALWIVNGLNPDGLA